MITVGYISVDKWIETRPVRAAVPPQDSTKIKMNDSKWHAFVDKSGGQFYKLSPMTCILQIYNYLSNIYFLHF